MRALFVTPVEEGSGETVTSVHVAERLRQAGWTVAFLGSEFALGFVPPPLLARRWLFGRDGHENRRTWDTALRELRPHAVVFADYPLMFFARGSAPLARVPGWVASLEHVQACLITFDHFGFARQTGPLFMGPPHLGIFAHQFEPLPPRMRVLLPCPMHEPGERAGRIGEPFRYWEVPLRISPDRRRAIRDTWVGGDPGRLLVFHFVPNWSWRHAELLGLPFYSVLPRLLNLYFAPLADRVTFVSLNNGGLLRSDESSRLRLTNLGPVPVGTFEALLHSADLVLTENGLSISIGKAVCAKQVCAVLRNGFRLAELMARSEPPVREALAAMEWRRLGAVYPFDVFPTVTPTDLDAIGLYAQNSIADGFVRLEVFGGRETALALERLLCDDATRARLRDRQQAYIDDLARLDDVGDILERVVQRA